MSGAAARECGGRCAARSRAQLALLLAAACAFFTLQSPNRAAAFPCINPPCPLAADTATDAGHANLAATGAVAGATNQFLQSLLRHSGGQSAAWSAGANASPAGAALPFAYAPQADATNDPLAAYAAVPAQANPRYRAWVEGYGSRARTDGQGTYTGDVRKAFGGVAGLGATLAPGVNIAASIDQDHTRTDVNGGTQNSRIDMTQVGAIASFDRGPWTLAVVGSYGFGRIHSARLETAGEAVAFYDTHAWGALAELSYYWTSGNWRLVPKAGIDWTQGSNDSYAESGGTTPVMATGQTSTRTRGYGALEVGYTDRIDTMLYDVSIYGKAIDILAQDVPPLLVTPLNGAAALAVPGVLDADFEFGAGTQAGLRIASNLRIYLLYDGRFRSDFESHAGTVGMELRW